MSISTPYPALKMPYFFLHEVADALRVSVKIVRREVKKGKLRSFKIGGRRCVLDAEIQVYREATDKL
jgi:excisionase family DNA binding protein